MLDSEKGELTRTQVKAETELSFDEQIQQFEMLLEKAGFDAITNVLIGFSVLYDRYYDDLDKRNTVKEHLVAAFQNYALPADIRVNFMLRFGDIALAHRDTQTVLQLVEETRGYFTQFHWIAEQQIPVIANIEKLRFQAGDTKKAEAELDAALSLYEQHETEIWDFHRSETLFPLAEVYQFMGNSEKAHAVYQKAVEAGALNANLMPRAEDLTQTCCSMASSGLQPDPDLWKYMQDIKATLVDPYKDMDKDSL
jgi:tetratricopeptide (TPR) repeat protein